MGLSFTYEFAGFGERVDANATKDSPLRVEKNRFYFDVGNGTPEQGVFDNHHIELGSSFASSSAILAHHVDAVWGHYDGSSHVCFVCHTNPDPDSILSFYLCKETIRHGWKRVDEIPKGILFPFIAWTGFAGMNYGVPDGSGGLVGYFESTRLFPQIITTSAIDFLNGLGALGHLAGTYLLWFLLVRGVDIVRRLFDRRKDAL